MNNIIKEIGQFIFVEDMPKKADVIITVGGGYPQIAEKAAELYKKGYAPYVIAGGGYSVKTGHFHGPRDKCDIYNKKYQTECDFYSDVLQHNGVPENAILREDKSGHTRENAEFANLVLNEHGITVKTIIVVCKKFHARRCQMFFQSTFHDSEILIVPADVGDNRMSLTKDNWYTTSYGTNRVLGELNRCGSQITTEDIERFIS